MRLDVICHQCACRVDSKGKRVKYVFLSHALTRELPVYGGGANLEITQVKSLEGGDSSNVYRFGMENHWGTHVDCPAHFFQNGMRISDYAATEWIFESPFLLETGMNENRVIIPEDVFSVPETADMLLIKTGFACLRGSEKYVMKNPGFSPEAGFWLRKNRPAVRAVGFDFVSLSPFHNREMGREAHRAFLDPEGENAPIRIIEDMHLIGNISRLVSVWVAPLVIEGLDSAPCTVIGALEE
ncbi:MAG: cyclase [Nitrospirae bacterium]|nr:MAG: cyclase [Nitrospirota bacterium]